MPARMKANGNFSDAKRRTVLFSQNSVSIQSE